MDFVFICTSLLLLASPCWTYRMFQERVPNGNNIPHPCKANYRWPGVGHLNPAGGGDRNVFGLDFYAAGTQWTPELCAKDSDGDGMTNGQELGDPDCIWAKGDIPPRTTGISHPGICDPFNSEQCKGKNDFVSCELDRFESCDITNDVDVITKDMRFSTVSVPPTETNYYCMTFDLPSDQDYHIVASEPLLDNVDVIHHMLLYGCNNKNMTAMSEPVPCGMSADADGCWTVLATWTVGDPGACWGREIGFRVGQSSFTRVRLEAHYNNPGLVSGYTDTSGLRLYLKPPQPGVQDLVTFVTGQVHLEIPPGRNHVEQYADCPGSCSQYYIHKKAYIVGAMNHMHYLGYSMKVEQYRNGTKLRDIANDENFSYDSPVSHHFDPPIEFLPGDGLVTTCTYNSLSTDRYTYYGDATSDEMCFGFLTIYPAQSVQYKWCINSGPLNPCERWAGAPIGACHWREFVNPENPETMMRYLQLSRNCNLDGFCRPECKAVVDTMRDHACLQGEAEKFVKKLLLRSPEGVKMLGWLHSCPLPDLETCKDTCSQVCPKQGSRDGDSNGAFNMAANMAVMVSVAFGVAMYY